MSLVAVQVLNKGKIWLNPERVVFIWAEQEGVVDEQSRVYIRMSDGSILTTNNTPDQDLSGIAHLVDLGLRERS